MRKTCLFGGAAILILIISSCFHGRQTTSVIGYRNQMVFLKKDIYYKVGELPAGWRKLNTYAKAAAFYNKELGATISTSAFCGGGFEDLPPRVLTSQLFAGTAKRRVLKEEEFALDGRGALKTVSTGETDGVSLKFSSVVLKKNNCTVDFVYFASPENFDGGVSAFEGFYKGFAFNERTNAPTH